MTETRIFQIDAFTDRPFAGNPAAVCLLEGPREEAWMQSVAAEMNLSETAFVHRADDGFNLRWFTPIIEVDLCGHATLATAHALWSSRSVPGGEPIRFQTRSGTLICSQNNEYIEMDFPARPVRQAQAPQSLLDVLGIAPSFMGQTQYDRFFVVEHEDALRSLQPDFAALRAFDVRGIIVTSLSRDSKYDFLSRFFAPGSGIDEDPVTGSAHCSLGPYWAGHLGKTRLSAFQASARGGAVRITVAGERVVLAGQAITVLEGVLLAG